MNPWATVRAATRHRTPAARCRRGRRSRRPRAARGARAACATASPAPSCPAPRRRMPCGRPTSFEVSAPADAVQRWSTDPRSRVPALPRLGPTTAAALPADGSPGCRHPWLGRARRREWARATDDTDVSSAASTTTPTSGDEETPRASRVRQVDRKSRSGKRFGQAVVDRLAQLGVAIVAGLALCTELPAVRLVVSWRSSRSAAGLGADPRDHHAASADSDTASVRAGVLSCRCCHGSAGWSAPSRGSRSRALQALFPALFGLPPSSVRQAARLAVLVRRRCGR